MVNYGWETFWWWPLAWISLATFIGYFVGYYFAKVDARKEMEKEVANMVSLELKRRVGD